MKNSRAAKEEELLELACLQRDTFRPEDPDIQRYLSYVFEDSTYSLDQTRVLEVDGEIVSHLRVWNRSLRLGQGSVHAGGIGSLLTLPNRRGKGYGRLLLEETEEYLKREGYRLAFLFSSIGTRFYERLGWSCVPLPLWRMQVDLYNMNPSPDQAVIRRLDSRDLARVADLYQSEIEGMTGPEVRTPAYWISGPSRQRGVFPNWGIELSGGLAGYLHLHRRRGSLMINEAALFSEAVGPAVEFVLQETKEAGIGTITIDLPYQHPLLIGLQERLGERGSLQMRLREELMVKILDPQLVVDFDCSADEGIRWLFRLVHSRNRDLEGEALAWKDSWKRHAGYYWRSDAF